MSYVDYATNGEDELELAVAIGYLRKYPTLTTKEVDALESVADSALSKSIDNFGSSYTNVSIADKEGNIICDFDLYDDTEELELNSFELFLD